MGRWIVLLLVCLLWLPAPLYSFDLGEADLDGDGYLSVEDLRIIGTERSTLTGVWRGDVTGDGRVNDDDVRALARLLLTGAGRRNADESVIQDLIQGITRTAPGESPVGRTVRGSRDDHSDQDLSPEIRELVRTMDQNRDRLSVRNLTDLARRNGFTLPTAGEASGGSGSFRSPDGSTTSPGRRSAGGATGPGGGSSPGSGGFSTAGPGKGKPPKYADDLMDYVGRLDSASQLASVLRDGINSTVEEINSWRNRRMTASPAGRMEEIFQSAIGQTLKQVAASEYPDSLMKSAGDAGSLSTTGMGIMSDSSQISRGTFYPRSAYDLLVEKTAADKPEVTSRVRSASRQPMDEVYQPVSATEDEEALTSPLLENEVKDLTDDPYMAQLMKDLDSVTTYLGEVGDARKGPKDRASSLLPLFEEPAREPMIRGDGSRFGLNNQSPYVKDYVPMAEELLPKLAETGAISQGEADQMIQEIRQLQQAIMNPGGGGGGSDSDPFGDFLATLDGLSGGAVSGATGGLAGGGAGGSAGGSAGSAGAAGAAGAAAGAAEPAGVQQDAHVQAWIAAGRPTGGTSSGQ